MNFKTILIALIVSSLLIGCVSAASIQEFRIDGPVKEIFGSDDFVIYADSHGDAGLGIYKNIDNDGDNNTTFDNPLENLVYNNGNEYLTPDNDMKIRVNPDHTANFTDNVHGTKGISELINNYGEEYVVIFWAKSSSDVNMTNMKADIDNFNKINNATPIAF